GSIDTQSLKTSLSGCYDAALLTPVCDVDSIDQFKKVVKRKPSSLGRKRLAFDAKPLTPSQRTLPLRENNFGVGRRHRRPVVRSRKQPQIIYRIARKLFARCYLCYKKGALIKSYRISNFAAQIVRNEKQKNAIPDLIRAHTVNDCLRRH